MIYDGSSFGTATFAGSAEEEEFLGLPGLLEPDQVRALLRQRQERQLATRSQQAKDQPAEPAPARPVGVAQRIGDLRKELNTLVAMYHHRTGKPHGKIHSDLRAYCGGPPTAMATMDQLEERIATLRSW